MMVYVLMIGDEVIGAFSSDEKARLELSRLDHQRVFSRYIPCGITAVELDKEVQLAAGRCMVVPPFTVVPTL